MSLQILEAKSQNASLLREKFLDWKKTILISENQKFVYVDFRKSLELSRLSLVKHKYPDHELIVCVDSAFACLQDLCYHILPMHFLKTDTEVLNIRHPDIFINTEQFEEMSNDRSNESDRLQP